MKKNYIHPETEWFALVTLETYLQAESLPKTDDDTIDDSDDILINQRHENEFEKGLW